MKCSTCMAYPDVYPYYGLAPHIHKRINNKCVTTFLPKNEWPSNFEEDTDTNGTYYCPDEMCENSIVSKKTE